MLTFSVALVVVLRWSEPYKKRFSLGGAGIAPGATAISCKQEVECFPVGAAAELAYILPLAIREEQTHWPKAWSRFCLIVVVMTCTAAALVLSVSFYTSELLHVRKELFSLSGRKVTTDLVFHLPFYSSPTFSSRVSLKNSVLDLDLIHPLCEAFPWFKWRDDKKKSTGDE